jgi:DNA-binding MarR family transcriptional regulator
MTKRDQTYIFFLKHTEPISWSEIYNYFYKLTGYNQSMVNTYMQYVSKMKQDGFIIKIYDPRDKRRTIYTYAPGFIKNMELYNKQMVQDNYPFAK